MNATATLPTPATLQLTAPVPPGSRLATKQPTSSAALSVRYLYADWPVATLFNAAGFPALPFNLTVSSSSRD